MFDSLLWGTDRTVLSVGPVQCGKSIASVYAFLLWASRNYRGEDFVIGTRTQRQFEGAVLKYARMFADSLGVEFRRRGEPYLLGGNRFYSLVGSDIRSEEKARSFSAAGAFLDEVTLLPYTFINSVMDRCSTSGARVLMATNPAGPSHPINTDWVMPADQPDSDIRVIRFQLSDNPALTDSYVQGLLARYHGAMGRRMVYGEWAASTGLIYPHIASAVRPAPHPREIWRWTVGVDYASSGTTHAVLVGQAKSGQWVMDEWVHNGLERGQLTEVAQAKRICRWAAGRNVQRISVDPSALGLRRALQAVFPRVRVVAADSHVLDGIGYVRQQTETGKLWIGDNCDQLIGEMLNYQWDEKAGLVGDDRPVKMKDHGCDALRYEQWTGARRRSPGMTVVRRRL